MRAALLFVAPLLSGGLPRPWRGRAQIREFFIFLLLLLIYVTFSKQLGIIHYLLIACLIAILVEGFFEHNLGDSEVLMLMLSIIGIGYAAIRSAQQSERQVTAE